MKTFSITRITEQITPYLVLGTAIALLFGVFILLSYVLVWGLIIGLVLWIIARIRIFLNQRNTPAEKKPGRIIEHNDRDVS